MLISLWRCSQSGNWMPSPIFSSCPPLPVSSTLDERYLHTQLSNRLPQVEKLCKIPTLLSSYTWWQKAAFVLVFFIYATSAYINICAHRDLDKWQEINNPHGKKKEKRKENFKKSFLQTLNAGICRARPVQLCNSVTSRWVDSTMHYQNTSEYPQRMGYFSR